MADIYSLKMLLVVLESPSLVLLQERRFVEVRRLQVQVEEHQEKNKTLAGINEKLRHLYEVASNRGDLLSVDVDTLSAKWRRVNEELAKNPTNVFSSHIYARFLGLSRHFRI